MTFTIGSLVRVRGREWVVLPESKDEILVLRPLGGSELEKTGINSQLEVVELASFAPPDPALPGDYRSCRLLRDAVRLGFRASAGPFRSFAHLGVEPRSYQLVPLMVALRQETVRLLIADDVGIGKTVEAALIAKEWLERHEIKSMAVLCPPHLAEQWQAELNEKFHLDAKLVLASTANQLQKTCLARESIFQRYPLTIISIDFIKSDQRREQFLQFAPDLVIVDEAHTCSEAGEGGKSRQQRFRLLSKLAEDPNRHLLLVTATPHSGNETAFRSLLSLLNADFVHLPDDLTGTQHERERRELARYFVQRRRGDIKAYLQEETPFPDRRETEQHYSLSPAYRRLFEHALEYAHTQISDSTDRSHQQQRVRYWSLLALLRSLASSPAAAAATLRNRASTAASEDAAEADKIGRQTVMDLDDDDTSTTPGDTTPGTDYLPADDHTQRGLLLAMANEAEALQGNQDAKLLLAVKLAERLLKDGFTPIFFCRFIPTAEYLARELSARLKNDVQVEAITGTLPPVERENRILLLSQHPRRILVATDCLSEGINLQAYFDAVVHYDLSWNPTRHEQREGRVDRYGQSSPEIRVVTCYGKDNPVDGIVLDVLIKKHHRIRTSLGISVPVPANSEQVLEAIFEGALMRSNGKKQTNSLQLTLPGLEDVLTQQFEMDWQNAAEREKRSRTMFAQDTINPTEVATELAATRSAMGSRIDVEHFVTDALSEYSAGVSTDKKGVLKVDFAGLRGKDGTHGVQEGRALNNTLREALQREQETFKARFELPIADGELYLSRTHPVVESLATFVMDAALDSTTGSNSGAKRCGVMRTSAVSTRTTLLLVRLRYHILSSKRLSNGKIEESTLLAEDCQVLAYQGAAANAVWFDDPNLSEHLLSVAPDGNVHEDQAHHFLRNLPSDIEALRSHLEEVATARASELAAAHNRVRQIGDRRDRAPRIRSRVEPQFPVDMLGVYVYLPKGQQ